MTEKERRQERKKHVNNENSRSAHAAHIHGKEETTPSLDTLDRSKRKINVHKDKDELKPSETLTECDRDRVSWTVTN